VTKTNASVLLDLIRGLAALLVLLEHWRNIFFVDYPQLVLHRILFAPLYILCSAGHQAVVIFFILSGYFISGSVFRMLNRESWSWSVYLTHRLLRLWIVLVPGLLLCALWDGMGLHFGMAPKLYSGMSGDHLIGNVAATRTVPIFAANLFYLQGILTPSFGSDGALWSLANEFWYYILFPLGLFVVHPRSPVRTRVICFAFFAGISWLIGPQILSSFPIWLLGTALALIPVAKLSNKVRMLMVVLYVPLFFWIGRARHLPSLLGDYLLAAATVALFWSILSAASPCVPSLGERLSRGVSRFSFTLYVGHTPLCVLFAALLIGDARWVPTSVHFLSGFLVLVVLIGYAYGVAHLTEFHTDRVRRWLEPRLLGLKDLDSRRQVGRSRQSTDSPVPRHSLSEVEPIPRP
jgi:peptidoglycan/LPS O-acetylase OafA/YrhL